MLSDEHWSKLWPIMSQNGIYDKPDLRHTTEGILYEMRVGCGWRDLPEEHWKWKKVYSRFSEWSKKDKLMSIFQALVDAPDMEWKIIALVKPLVAIVQKSIWLLIHMQTLSILR